LETSYEDCITAQVGRMYINTYKPLEKFKMKRLFIFNFVTALTLALTACAGGTSGATNSEPDDVQTQGTFEPLFSDNDQIPVNQLVLGTMQLESADLAISRDQATDLLPLWKAYQSLIQSDTAAQAEVEAVLRQIKTTMTADQLEFIRSMEVSPDEIQAAMQEANQESGTDRSTSGGGFNRPEGFEPGGGPGFAPDGGMGGGPGFGPEGDRNPEQMATLQAERGGSDGFQNRAGAFFVAPLIEMLGTIVDGTVS
jgi:hypothetical protein